MSAAAIEALIILLAKYGPPAVEAAIALLKKPDPTIADVEATFALIKPYDAYGIVPPKP